MIPIIKEYLDSYLEGSEIELSKEEYEAAYRGAEYWLQVTLPEAVADSVTSVRTK